MRGRSGRIIVLAGPGVIDADAVVGLRTFAAAGGLGVANTWGAKGVFAWDSPHHLGTAGLQARDFELLGFADADLIVATGIDERESPKARFALAPVETIEPVDLAALAGTFRAAGEPIRNDLYPVLAAIAQPGYVDDKVPLHPARAVADLGAALPPGGLLTAEPGVAGLWVARTFPTPALEPAQPRRVVVPSDREPGRAASLALDAARAGRRAVVVVTAPIDAATSAVIDEARRAGAALVVVVWDARGDVERAVDHRALLDAALGAPGVTIVAAPVAFDDTAALVDAAGAVVAWGGLEPPP